MFRRAHPIWILLPLVVAAGCTGLSAGNVGDPTLQDRLDFRSSLALLHVGMPVDSLDLLFAPALEPGDTGILRRARVATSEGERLSYELGWLSDPRHQVGHKAIDDIEVVRAWVRVEQGRISSIHEKE